MAQLTADQRNYYYLLEAERTGIHKPILAALYTAHQSPSLAEGGVGLGIAPANRIAAADVDSFLEQVQFAASTIRSITNRLTAQGLRGIELWDSAAGRYSDRFLQVVSEGYAPPANDTAAARLEPTDLQILRKAYLADLTLDYQANQLPQSLAFLDPALIEFVDQVPLHFSGLTHERNALLEAVRLWRKLENRQQTLEVLFGTETTAEATQPFDEIELDLALMRFVQRISSNYAGFPHQREGLLRLAQLWRQLDSREAAIASLQQSTSAETHLEMIDPALIAFVSSIPQSYQSNGEQRSALTEAFRLWRGLDSRAIALKELGVDPQGLMANANDSNVLANAAAQLDQRLLAFVRRIPAYYGEQDAQREALIRLVQLWRGFSQRELTLQVLLDDMRRMEQAKPHSADAAPRPEPAPLPPRPNQWSILNLQLNASIIPNGNFTWAEATHGGTRLPPNQATVDAIIRIATMAQQARDRLGQPMRVINWYQPADPDQRTGDVISSRHGVGDALDFYCDGLTGDQIYRALDPWWSGGLGRYARYSQLVCIDARSDRTRWRH